MSGSNSALALMDENHHNDGNDESKSNDCPTRKQKFYAINQDVAKLIDEEQIAAATDGTSILSVIRECKARTLRLLKDPNRKEYFSSNIESSDAFLRSHLDSKANLVILYADLVGSTHMSTVLGLRDLTTILQIFIQEMSIIAVKNHGYILKYVGDAVIVYFPIVDDNFSLASNSAISCALNMVLVVEQGINPILKEFGFPTLQIKIGIDSGENAIVEYAFNIKNSHVDIIGYPMNIAAKITSLAPSNHLAIGIATYRHLDSNVERRLRKMGLESTEYIDYQTGDAYTILSLPLDKYI
ncbi:MAG TPA: adenylate/guanylate cyclase domain-containing protein [Nitrososphaeraceae archaeon]|nr:adenylate/guanylate cyclase domain-containing protein [Nitrososphaeraceae archaeon]